MSEYGVLNLSHIQAAHQAKRATLAQMRCVQPHGWAELGTMFLAELSLIPLEDPVVVITVVVDLAEQISRFPGSALFGDSAQFVQLITATNPSSQHDVCRTLDAVEENLRIWLSRAARPSLATRAAEYVDTHLPERLTLRVISQALGCSEKRLSVSFKQQTHMTVHEYITQERMRRAGELLRQGEKVEVVMLTVGYRNKTHFYERFADYAGMTPGGFGRPAHVTHA